VNYQRGEEGGRFRDFCCAAGFFFFLFNVTSEAFKDSCGLYEDGDVLLTLAKLYPCSNRLGAAEAAESASVAESRRGQQKSSGLLAAKGEDEFGG